MSDPVVIVRPQVSTVVVRSPGPQGPPGPSGEVTQAELDAHATDANLHGGSHPDLAAHDLLGLATDDDLATKAPLSHSHVDADLPASIARDTEVTAAVDAHAADTTAVHGIADTAALVVTTDPRLSDDRAPTAHALDGAKHTVSGLTAGHVLRATGASSFAFGAIADADIPATIARDSELPDLAGHVAAADPHAGYRLESVPISAADVAADIATQAELDARAAKVFNVPAFGALVSHTNWNTFAQSNVSFFGGRNTSSGAQNAQAVYALPSLAAGTWTLVLLHSAFTNRGIYTIAVSEDGASWTTLGTVDGYSSTSVQTRSELTGLAIPLGTNQIRLIMATKNASSSGFFGAIDGIIGHRTAA